MPRKQKVRPAQPLAPVPAEILDQFVRQGPLTPEELDATVRRFKKAVIERALGAELSHHLGLALAVLPDGTREILARRALVAIGHESICDALRGSLHGAGTAVCSRPA